MSNIKRVLHFQGRLGRGGAESFMMNAFRQIDRTKYVFDFVIYREYENIRPYHDEIHTLGGKIYVVTNPNKNIFKYINEVKKILKNNQVDIVHNEIFFGGGLNLYLAKKAGIKQRIAHSHATTDGKGNRLPYNLVRPLFKKMLFDNATDYLACSKEAGIGLFGDIHSFKVIPNGIDLEKFQKIEETKNEIRLSLNIPNDAFLIGHIGRFEEQKNHKFLLEIFKEVLKRNHKAYLMLVGTGSLVKDIKQQARLLNMEDHVLFVGERNDVPRLFKSMDLFLMPSLYEGLPMVAVEAQASNLKLVLSDEISRDTVLSSNVNFLSLNDSLEDWAQEILSSSLNNKPLPELQQFDQNNTAKLLEEIYS